MENDRNATSQAPHPTTTPQLIRTLGLSLLLLFSALLPVRAVQTPLPDSLITKDNVYRFMLTDTEKAEQIMASLRKQKKLSGWELDFVEGELYYNTGRHHMALYHYTNVRNDREAAHDSIHTMDVLSRMIACYDVVHNYVRLGKSISRLLELAQATGNKAMESVALFSLGKSEYRQGDKGSGYLHMENAAALMEQCDYKNKFDNLRFDYNTLLTYYERDLRGDDALRTLNNLKRVTSDSTGKDTPIEGFNAKERKNYYGHLTVVLNMLGRHTEADAAFRQFQANTQGEADAAYVIVMPYLFNRKMYAQALRVLTEQEQWLKQNDDTVSYRMATIRESLGNAYYDMGDYKQAADNFLKLAVLRDSIKYREQQSEILANAEIYKSNQKDLQLQERRTRNYVLCVVSLAAFVLLSVALHFNAKLSKRNKSLVKMVEQGLRYKDETLKLRQDTPHHPLPEAADSPTADAGGDKTAPPQAATGDTQTSIKERVEHERFNHMIHLIESQQIFLRPGLTKDDLARITQYPAYLIAPSFKKYLGTTFITHINRLRMEHAAKLLLSTPNASIDEIAQRCGVESRQHFHRLFSEYFGVTPKTFIATRPKA